MINIKDVMSVYSGKARTCCCGCAGKHTYASTYQEAAGANRGYEVKDNEVSDRSVKTIVNKLNKLIDFDDPNAADTMLNDEFASFDTGTRTLIAYFVKRK